MTKTPTTTEVAARLRFINNTTNLEPEDQEWGIDVRLQVLPNDWWYVHSGSPSYDTDHDGYWGATTIPGNSKRFNSIETARDLINQTEDQIAETDQ